jgi:hypothetical protein
MKKLQALIAVAIIAILTIAIAPASALSATEQIKELRMDLKESAPALGEYSLPYTLLTAADMCVKNGRSDMVPALLGTHFRNALAYQEKQGKISDKAMKEMFEKANELSLA